MHHAVGHQPTHAAFAGDVTPQEAWAVLLEQPGALLVDVRTLPEWQFIGFPDLTQAPGQLARISWKHYPNFAPNTDFASQLAETGVAADAPIFFLCRSGGRSTDAAIAMTAQGYTQCYNVSGGFEGEQNEQGQRGKREGWKAANLPWTQG